MLLGCELQACGVLTCMHLAHACTSPPVRHACMHLAHHACISPPVRSMAIAQPDLEHGHRAMWVVHPDAANAVIRVVAGRGGSLRYTLVRYTISSGDAVDAVCGDFVTQQAWLNGDPRLVTRSISSNQQRVVAADMFVSCGGDILMASRLALTVARMGATYLQIL
jgi:hypothetical protein